MFTKGHVCCSIVCKINLQWALIAVGQDGVIKVFVHNVEIVLVHWQCSKLYAFHGQAIGYGVGARIRAMFFCFHVVHVVPTNVGNVKFYGVTRYVGII